jgi:hypothetical protein
MRGKRAALTVGALAAAALPAGALAASTPKHWTAGHGNSRVTCGEEIGSPTSTYVLCSARGLKLPKSEKNQGDPFIQVAATGKAKVVPISQDSYFGKGGRLAPGSTWKALGVTCKVSSASLVKCKNGTGHGFTLGGAKPKIF